MNNKTIRNLQSEIRNGTMNAEEMKKRTKAFALKIIQLVDKLPPGMIKSVVGRQLLKSGTSVGANYRAACRARSVADFISKMGIVEEEADESIYWLELLVDSGTLAAEKAESLITEADEILAITVSSIRTARRNK